MAEKNNTYTPFGGDEVRPVDLASARVVVLPLCYEHAPSYGTGSSDGPFHLLYASSQLEALDEETLQPWGDAGIYTLPPLRPDGEPEQAVQQMQTAAADVLLQGKFLLSLGGDHAVSIGPIAAAAESWPGLGVLQVDAHLDLRDEWNGSRYNHACVMRRVNEDMGLPIVQVGIRSVAPEEAEYLRRNNFHPFYAHELDGNEDAWIEQVIHSLPETVYLTLDLDGLDPSVIPGTGTPEPGGLSYRQIVKLIKALCRHRKVVAADVNELVKVPGMQVSEFTAAKIAVKLIVHAV